MCGCVCVCFLCKRHKECWYIDGDVCFQFSIFCVILLRNTYVCLYVSLVFYYTLMLLMLFLVNSLETRTHFGFRSVLHFFADPFTLSCSIASTVLYLQKLSTRCHANNTCHSFNACNLVWLTLFQHTYTSHRIASLLFYSACIVPRWKTRFMNIIFEDWILLECKNRNRMLSVTKKFNFFPSFLVAELRLRNQKRTILSSSSGGSSGSINIKSQRDDDQFMGKYK